MIDLEYVPESQEIIISKKSLQRSIPSYLLIHLGFRIRLYISYHHGKEFMSDEMCKTIWMDRRF